MEGGRDGEGEWREGGREGGEGGWREKEGREGGGGGIPWLCEQQGNSKPVQYLFLIGGIFCAISQWGRGKLMLAIKLQCNSKNNNYTY